MKTEVKDLGSLLNKISFTQLLLLCSVSIVYFFFKQYEEFTGFLIGGGATFSYTQLIRLSSYNKIIAIYGFPLRLFMVAIPAAILVHNLHSNLIALFTGFAIGQLIYFLIVWFYIQNKKET